MKINPNPGAMKTTPNNIITLLPNQVFVFGANEEGIHGKGAAKTAIKFGALYYFIGRVGQSYGIPTKKTPYSALSLHEIKIHVNMFLEHSGKNLHEEFLVTKIGCGLAGYNAKDIAPMFKDKTDNVIIPEEFVFILLKDKFIETDF